MSIQPEPTWAEIYARAKAAFMAGSWESFFRETAQNKKEMRNIKYSLMSQAEFVDHAEGKALAEAQGVLGTPIFQQTMGGYDG